MGGGPGRKATYAELEAVAPHLKQLPQGRGDPGGWLLLFEPALHLGEDVLVPDLAAWRREHMPEMPEVVGFTLTPDWVCEVLSASTAALDRDKKMKAYAREGVRHLWRVDPLERTLEVYGLHGEGWALLGKHHGQVRLHVEPFMSLLLELGTLWAR